MVHAMLSGDGPNHLLGWLPETEERNVLYTAMKRLGEIQGYAVARLLSAEEINRLEGLIEDFCTLLRTYYPDLCTTTKFHMLEKHVIPFVRRHGSWGQLSEQPLEHYHSRSFFKFYKMFS